MRGIMPVGVGSLLVTAGLMTAGLAPDTAALAAQQAAPDRLLRCATLPALAQPGPGAIEPGRHGLYAPVQSAMFYTPVRSRCGWHPPRLRRG